MKRLVLITSSFVTVFGLAACAINKKSQDSAANLNQWQGNMHGLSDSLSKLLPLTTSSKTFSEPENLKVIKQETQRLKSVAHVVDETKVKPGSDPGMAFMAKRFAANMEEANRQIELGNHSAARSLIRQSTSYCISCHTRTGQGRSELQLSSFANVEKLKPLEQLDLLIALRDYEKALSKFDQIINSIDAQLLSPFDLEVAAEKALAIAVRVKRDPVLAQDLATRIFDAKWAPVYLRLNAMAWKQGINEWRNDQTRPRLTPKDQFLQAKSILEKGWRASANAPGKAGLIHFLRASTVFHELLSLQPRPTGYAEYLYYAGLTAEALRQINLWTLQDVYYEACIRELPHSAQAEKCYLRLEAVQLSSFATDDGAFLPMDLRDRLLELRDLSRVKKNKWSDTDIFGD